MNDTENPADGELLPSEVLPPESPRELLAVLHGHESPVVRRRVEQFYLSVASMFEAWVNRSANPNTVRTYRRAVENFIEFLGLEWPKEAHRMLSVSVDEVRAWRDFMVGDPNDPEAGQAPATVNARVSALSAFYNFMRETAATELKLPVVVSNPAHAQFIRREGTEPRTPTIALKRNQAHKLMSLPKGDSVLATRDRAILAVFLYAGIRIRTACVLTVSGFQDDSEDPVLEISEKGRGKSKRRIGIHAHCAEALREHLTASRILEGPLFRARKNARSEELGATQISQPSMYRLLLSYLERLPHSRGDKGKSRYTPHSLRATTATLLDDAGVPITRIQELLGHKDIRVTEGYIKQLRDTRKSASHDVPL